MLKTLQLILMGFSYTKQAKIWHNPPPPNTTEEYLSPILLGLRYYKAYNL